MKKPLQQTILSVFAFLIAFSSLAQTTNTYTTATTWTVPAGVFSLTIKVYGGAGGTGGQDCGDGCSNAAAGQAGYVHATYAVTPGDLIGIYPGGNGANGGDNESGAGGGAGGTGSYPSGNYNGGNGGNAGSSGSSGGGGGGGAASVVSINSIIKIVSGGAGGGGGMANLNGSGYDGNSSTSPNGTTTGDDGATPGGDGGGGGGSGGGQFASTGGSLHAAGGEDAGDGGFRGSNSVSGAVTITTDGSTDWTNPGQIEITFVSTLPVRWLSFTANKLNNKVLLSWTTAAEQNAKHYEVQRSANGANWVNIGLLPAAGNTGILQQYRFTDAMPLAGINHYRLLQRDMDDKMQFSKVLFCDFSDAESGLKIYPNPVNDGSAAVYLQQASTVLLYNSNGSRLMQKEFPAGSSMLDLSQLPKGTYYLKTNNERISFLVQ